MRLDAAIWLLLVLALSPALHVSTQLLRPASFQLLVFGDRQVNGSEWQVHMSTRWLARLAILPRDATHLQLDPACPYDRRLGAQSSSQQ